MGFDPILLQGEGYMHQSYAAQLDQADATLHVYIEHDGTPWASIDRVAADPTPRKPYALELMAKDAGPRLLLGRPCYFAAQPESRCSPVLWTHERYSGAVVASMVAALRNYLSAHPHRRLVLVGYSGGGSLAWLMAPRVPEAAAVVTVAANLDTDAWARWHGYSALAGSLNPAAQPSLPERVEESHFIGASDSNVRPAVVRGFARRHPRAKVIELAGFDHDCCWIAHWSRLLAGLAL